MDSCSIRRAGNVTFSIPSDVASNKFTIGPNGLVTLGGALDRETIGRYFVSILARSSKLLDITTLEVIVTDENDNSPEFRPSSCYTLAVPENQETSVIHTVAATDLDDGKNGEVVYGIAGMRERDTRNGENFRFENSRDRTRESSNPILRFAGGNVGAKFTLDSVTGMLSMSNLDRETVSKYALTISAKDRGRQSRETRCNLTVIVLDVNDNAPTFVRNQYTESQSHNGFQYGSPSGSPAYYYPTRYVTTISEDVAPDSSVMSVKATDPDQGVNGRVTYAIAGETSWLFRIDNLTGVVTTAG